MRKGGAHNGYGGGHGAAFVEGNQRWPAGDAGKAKGVVGLVGEGTGKMKGVDA